MTKTITVVVSCGHENDPDKTRLEENIIAKLAALGVRVVVVPDIYDLSSESPAVHYLRGIDGVLVVLSWLYPRAVYWVLDRNRIRGTIGRTLLMPKGRQDPESRLDRENETENRHSENSTEVPARWIYCIDLRVEKEAAQYIEEIQRIAGEIGATCVAAAQDRPSVPVVVEENTRRRWYPVLDFDRCANCHECIDFCLFGVYLVDSSGAIAVAQPDNCRAGCPACARVCPQSAIIFPRHKTPAIAGGPALPGEMKIDLSGLFTAPQGDPAEIAARERDEYLARAGRDAVGPGGKRQLDEEHPKDELDDLLDKLDESGI